MDWLQILSNSASSILSPATIAYALAALGLAVHFGYAGLLNMGIAGFMALGAYGYAISILTFGLPWWAGVLVGMAAAAIFALILGIPTLRLRGDYLAIVTIAAAEVVRLLFLTTTFDAVTGSADGLSGYHTSFRASNPIPEGTYGFGPFDVQQRGLVGAHPGPRGPRARRAHRVAPHGAARGAACSRASVKTRTPCAPSARTSSSTRCRRWCSVA